MPRQSRLDVARTPQIVLQRSWDDRLLFRCAEDYRQFLRELHESGSHYGCAVHAYALLPREVCLLVTGPEPGSISRMMQSLGRRYAPYANARDDTRGPCWRGRYRSCPVGGDMHVLRASGYVEMSPVRAGLVSNPGTYRCSSYASNALGIPDPYVKPHKGYLALSTEPRLRCMRYRELVNESTRNDAQIRLHVEQGKAWGHASFLRRVTEMLGDRGPARPRGRPRKGGKSKIVPSITTLSPFILTGWFGLAQTLAAAM